nr:MAG: MC130L [Molluscum contagiosum virus]
MDERLRFGFPRVILEFERLVDKHWEKPLGPNACLSRSQRKVVRNVFRALVAAARVRNGKLDVLYPEVLENTFAAALLEHENHKLQTMYEQLTASGPQLVGTVVDTRGKYILYYVLSLVLSVRTETHTSADSRQATLRKFLVQVLCTHYVRRCKYMFVGLPAYLVQGLGPRDVVNLLTSLREVQLYDVSRGIMVSVRGMDAHIDKYIDFLVCLGSIKAELESASSGTPRVVLQQRWLRLETTLSVPEFVMEGLGFSARDSIRAINDPDARMYLARDSKGRYHYFALDHDYPAGVPLTYDPQQDISALALLSVRAPEELYRNRIVTPEKCTEFLFDEDMHKAPVHDYSKDLPMKADPNFRPREDAYGEQNLVPLFPLLSGLSESELDAELQVLQHELEMYSGYVRGLSDDLQEAGQCLQLQRARLSRVEEKFDALRKDALAAARTVDRLTSGIDSGCPPS